MPPVRPLAEIFFCTGGEYVTMSNGVFNFNFLGLLLSEILGGSQIYTRGPYAPWTPPSVEIFVPKVSTSQYLILTLVVSEILGGPKFTLEGPTPPGRPLAEKFLYPKRVLHNI